MTEEDSEKNARLKRTLDDLYARYNLREFVHPDPLEFLYAYDDPNDREIVGIVASSLAYGQVNQILKSTSFVLERMPSPSRFLEKTSAKSLENTFADFKYRFTTGEELAAMLIAAKRAIERHGSLNACFLFHMKDGDDTVLPALSGFVRELKINDRPTTLLPSPENPKSLIEGFSFSHPCPISENRLVFL